MRFPDILRWLIEILGCFSLLTLAVFYQHVGRFIVPRTTARLLVFSFSLLALSLMIEAVARLGEPLHWRTPLSLIGLGLYVVGLIRLDFWFRRPEGRKQRHAIIAAFLAEQMLRDPDAYEGVARALADDPEHAGRVLPQTRLERLLAAIRRET